MAQTQSAKNTTSNSNSSARTSVIAEGTVISGEFSTHENLRVDGTIKGDVSCEKRLVIGKTGFIEGNIKAAEIIINGSMSGEALSKGMLTLGSSSRAEGKISAANLSIEEGALFNGDFVVTKK